MEWEMDHSMWYIKLSLQTFLDCSLLYSDSKCAIKNIGHLARLGDITGSSYSLNRCHCTLSRTCLFHGFSLLFAGTGSAHGFDVLLEIQNRTIVLIKRNNWRIYGTGARHEKVLRLLTTNIPWCVTSRAQICVHELWLRILFSRNGRLFSLAGKRPVIRGRESVNTPHFTLVLKEYGW